MAGPRRALVVKLSISGIRETLKKFKELPPEASTELRDKTQALSSFLALKAKAAGFAIGGQAAPVATTIKANRDRVPSITMGGTKLITSTRKPAYKLLFGAEFGANGRYGWFGAAKYSRSLGRQYLPHAGTKGYFFFRSVDDNQAELERGWNQVADDIVDRFSRGD